MKWLVMPVDVTVVNTFYEDINILIVFDTRGITVDVTRI